MPYGRATPILLSGPERAELEGLARRRKAPQGLALRARIVLRCSEGLTNQAVAGEVSACAHTVGKWRERFATARLAGLSDEPRSGAPRLARLRPAAAPERDLQALDRPRIRGEGARHRRPLPRPTGPGAGPVRR